MPRPWLHWKTDDNDFSGNFSPDDTTAFVNAPYLTDQSSKALFSNVSSAESMMGIATNGVNKWYTQRRNLDFLDSSSQPLTNPNHVQRWMAHVLLTTTINIVPAQTSGGKWMAPADHFYDSELFTRYSSTGLLVGYHPTLNSAN
jgi:hypothetical protein